MDSKITELEKKVRDLTIALAAVAIVGTGFWIANTRRHGESQDLSMRTSCEALLALTIIAQDPDRQAELHSVTRGMTPNGVRRLPQCKGRLP
jgi:hypothetical protein